MLELSPELRQDLIDAGWIEPIPDSARYALHLGEVMDKLSDERDEIIRGFCALQYPDGSVSTALIGPCGWTEKLGLVGCVQARLHAEWAMSTMENEDAEGD
jgi:hypothetical protein